MQGVLILDWPDLEALIESANMRLEELARGFATLEGAELVGSALAQLRADIERQRRLVNLLEEADGAALSFVDPIIDDADASSEKGAGYVAVS